MGIYHQTIPAIGTANAIDQPQWAQSHVVDAAGITFSDSSVQTSANLTGDVTSTGSSATVKSVSGSFAIKGEIQFDISGLGGTITNLAPTGGGAAVIWKIINATSTKQTISSITAPPTNSAVILLQNYSTYQVYFSAASGANFNLNPDTSVLLVWSALDSNYKAVWGPAPANSATFQKVNGSYTFPVAPQSTVGGYAILWGGGGGGGGGARGLTNTIVKCAGNGGNSGAVTRVELDPTVLKAGFTYVVGAGGTGGAGGTSNATSGTTGTAGSQSSITLTGGTVYTAAGGNAGLGGTYNGVPVAQTANSAGGNISNGLTGGTGGPSATAGTSQALAVGVGLELVSGGGGGGAGVSVPGSVNTGETSGAGGIPLFFPSANQALGVATVSGVTPNQGGAGQDANGGSGNVEAGAGGGGGGGSNTRISVGSAGGKGGKGAGPGGGGGGGGACCCGGTTNNSSNNGGSGGNGADGAVLIVTY